jgi:hypothetical protein
MLRGPDGKVKPGEESMPEKAWDDKGWRKFQSDILMKLGNPIKRRKRYASFWWNFPDKPTKERGIICDLLEAIEAEGGHHGIVKVRKNSPDPPDCIGIVANGELVAFEARELVDQETVKRNEQGQRVWKEWTASGLIEKVRDHTGR